MATTTPNYGWSVPTSTDYVAQGAVAIETLGDSVDSTLFTALGGAYPGLRLIKKQTIGSGVSSINVTGAFSAAYENYKIVVSGGTATGGLNVFMTLGASTASYNAGLQLTTWSSSALNSFAGAGLAAFPYIGYWDTNGHRVAVDVQNPFLAKYTTYFGPYISVTASGTCSGLHQVNTSYTDFTLSSPGGTVTGGTIYVYGYGAS